MERNPLVRTIYLYLFTIIVLALIVTGGVRFIDMGLKATIFRQADAPEQLRQQYSCQNMYYGPSSIEKLEENQTSSVFTAEEQTTLKLFLANYKKCEEEGAKINYLTSQRQRDASSSLAMIIIGLPLYLYHWGIIRRETKARKQEE